MRVFLGGVVLTILVSLSFTSVQAFPAQTDAEKKAAELQAEEMKMMRENTFQITKIDDAIMSDDQAEGKDKKAEKFEKYSEPVNSQSQIRPDYIEPKVEMKSMKEVEALLGAYESDEVVKQLAASKAAEGLAQGNKDAGNGSVNPLNPNERRQQSCYQTDSGKVECVEISSPIEYEVTNANTHK